MRVLVVEDDRSIQRFVTRALARIIDGTFEVADTADGAIDLIKAATLDRPYDLVVSDFNLLRGTGGDVLEWVQAHASYLEPRFLFFSSDDAVAKLHKNYIEKPCDTPAFLRAVQATLDNART